MGKDVVIAGAAAVVAPEAKIAELVIPVDGAEVIADLANRLLPTAGSVGFTPSAMRLNALAAGLAGFRVLVILNDVAGTGLTPKSTCGTVPVSLPKR